MTIVETENERIEAMLKRDAFGFGEPGEEQWLRTNVDSVYVVLKVLYAKIESQVRVAENNLGTTEERDADWYRKVRNLEARLKPRLVEFETLYAAQRRSDLRSAIRRHRAALLAADGEPEAYDLTLWSHVEDDG